MISVSEAMALDLIVVSACVFLLWESRDRSAMHPGVLYLAFHLLAFTLRAWAIMKGEPTFLLATQEEIVRAMVAADLFLFALVIGCVLARSDKSAKREYRQLDPRVVRVAAWVGIPIGVYFIAKYAFVFGQASDSPDSSYSTLAITWPGTLLLALMYRFGLRKIYVVPFGLFVTLMAIQGVNRVRAVIPILLLVLVYLAWRRRKWPTVGMVTALIGMLLVFYPLDAISQSVQDGTFSVGKLWEIVAESSTSASKGTNTEQAILDMTAAGMGQGDKLGAPLWGAHYVDLIYLPVPRSLYPSKPVTNEHVVQLSDGARPLSTMGTILTIPGEAYVDFRWIGVGAIGVIVGLMFTRLYRRALSAGMGSAYMYGYIAIAASSVQVFRDGLTSVPVFMLVYNLPTVAILVANSLLPGANSRVGKLRYEYE